MVNNLILMMFSIFVLLVSGEDTEGCVETKNLEQVAGVNTCADLIELTGGCDQLLPNNIMPGGIVSDICCTSCPKANTTMSNNTVNAEDVEMSDLEDLDEADSEDVEVYDSEDLENMDEISVGDASKCSQWSSYNYVCGNNAHSGHGWSGNYQAFPHHSLNSCKAKCETLGSGCCEWRDNRWCLYKNKGVKRYSRPHRDAKVITCTKSKLPPRSSNGNLGLCELALERQVSYSSCKPGMSYGCLTSEKMYVRHGCRADFFMHNKKVHCASWNFKDKICELGPCSAKDYLHYNGIPQTPTQIQAGIIDTHDCKRGFEFSGRADSVVKYGQINLGGHNEFTFMSWVRLDDFGADVGLFSYGTYNGRCGFMAQLRVNRFNKDIHLRVKSNRRNTFHEYNSNQRIFTNDYINKWFHVAVVKNRDRIFFYLNGNPVGSRHFSDVISHCRDRFQLGRWIESALKVVDGNVRGIKLFSEAKSAAYVREYVNKRNGYTLHNNGPKCSTIGKGNIPNAAECLRAAREKGVTTRTSVHSGRWAWAPMGCFIGHPSNGWRYLYFNSYDGQRGRQVYRSICKPNVASEVSVGDNFNTTAKEGCEETKNLEQVAGVNTCADLIEQTGGCDQLLPNNIMPGGIVSDICCTSCPKESNVGVGNTKLLSDNNRPKSLKTLGLYFLTGMAIAIMLNKLYQKKQNKGISDYVKMEMYDVNEKQSML